MAETIQLRAGYILEAISRWIDSLADSGKLDISRFKGLYHNLSCFEVTSNLTLDKIDEAASIPTIVHNLIIRGIPTWPTWELENIISSKTNLFSAYEELGALEFMFSGDHDYANLFFRALHIIEPRINRNTLFHNYLKSWENLGSQFEEEYLYKEVPRFLNNGEGDFFIQFMEPQRKLDTMITNENALNTLRNNFHEQRADFVIEFPYLLRENGKRGICIEIDGSQHNNHDQKQLDERRDEALLDSNWSKTFRLLVSEFSGGGLKEHFNKLTPLLETDCFRIIKNNYTEPLYRTQKGLVALELMLSPFAIARIQHSIIRAILCRGLSLEDKVWKIAVIERDVPCAKLAIDDLVRIFNNLYSLEGKGRIFPEISLTVFNTEEFSNCQLQFTENINLVSDVKNDKSKYDLLIDISVLERQGLSKKETSLDYNNYIEIRSSFSQKTFPEFLSADRIQWKSVFKDDGTENTKLNNDVVQSLKFFLLNVFHKEDFRTGQLPILNRAIQNHTVIGLLPTGGGKSLTYQLAALLQPGFTLIIDPIKSLMKDQVDGLARVGINGTVFINSSLKTVEERQKALYKMKSGQALFCFVSPERLQMKEFRDVLISMAENGRFYNYGVIDEVHCVSEWGHDFRTSYLSLGRNLLEHCKAKKGEIALFGLTATASYDVLSDVQRELSGNRQGQHIPDEAIVRHETTNRDELQFAIRQVELSGLEIDEIKSKGKKDKYQWEIKAALGELKHNAIRNLLKTAPEIIDGFNNDPAGVITDDLVELTYNTENTKTADDLFEEVKLKEIDKGTFWNNKCTNAALVFAPHRTWYFGVTDQYKDTLYRNGIYDSIINDSELGNLIPGTFMGVDADDEKTAGEVENDNLLSQNQFIGNKLNLMVSTKAFGMGIDKPNIRFTIHASYPGSIESFIQEAGRAGRDHKIAVSVIVYNDQVFEDMIKPGETFEVDFDIQKSFYNNSFKGQEKEKAVIYELLNEVTHPRRKQTYDIARRLGKDEHNGQNGINFSLKFNREYGTLFLNDTEGNNYGYLRLKSNMLVTEKANVDLNLATKYLLSLQSLIADLRPGNSFESLANWLETDRPVDPTEGIERVLSGLEIGDKYEIVIPFGNDEDKIFHRLTKLLLPVLNGITPELCMSCRHSHAEDFLEEIFKKFNIENYQEVLLKNFGKEDELEQFTQRIAYSLNSLRDKMDTEKAIYRLSLIGVIDDYTIDYNSGTFRIFGAKKTDEEMHNHLRNYISKYYSSSRTEQIVKDLKLRKGNTEVQRILNYVIDFIYTEVAKKRFEAIKAMKTCCLIGLDQGNVEMKTWIHLYFNSKYARKDYSLELPDLKKDLFRTLPSKLTDKQSRKYNVSLLDWSNEGRESEFDWIIDFIHITEIDYNNAQKDNLKHLRGACTRFLITNPDNYVFRLLRAFSLLLLDEEQFQEKHIKMVSEDLEKGFQALWLKLDGNQEIFYNHLTIYKQHVIKRLTMKEVIDGFNDHLDKVMFLSHVRWTKKFEEFFVEL